VDREALLRRYRELVLDELPRRARAGRWVVVNDHCFGRIVLDNTVGGRWYDVLDRHPDRERPGHAEAGAHSVRAGRPAPDRRPAYARLDDERLAAAVALAERIAAEGDPLLRELDARSLAWRGKPAKKPVGLPTGGAARPHRSPTVG
jgi:hypothetical protein